MDYTEISLYLMEPQNENCDIVCSYLADIDFTGFQEEDNKLLAFIPEKIFSQDKLDVVLEDLFNKKLIEDTVKIRTVEDRNWNELWERNYFKPIILGNKVHVRGSFHEPEPNCELEIIIDPKMSFGTGHHQTTRMILEALISIDLKDKSVMDMGTGTGILALYAAMKGAKPVYAIDIDDWAVENCMENVEINNLKGKIHVSKGDVRSLGKLNQSFDIFIANINLGVLLDDIPMYLKYIKPSGTLFLSGFLQSDIEELKSTVGKDPIIIKQEGEWAMLAFTK